ncbi:Uncharacterised protein [Bordetella pertussis]|nr:Uncharacterised protein [Bordetella pertussis]
MPVPASTAPAARRLAGLASVPASRPAAVGQAGDGRAGAQDQRARALGAHVDGRVAAGPAVPLQVAGVDEGIVAVLPAQRIRVIAEDAPAGQVLDAGMKAVGVGGVHMHAVGAEYAVAAGAARMDGAAVDQYVGRGAAALQIHALGVGAVDGDGAAVLDAVARAVDGDAVRAGALGADAAAVVDQRPGTADVGHRDAAHAAARCRDRSAVDQLVVVAETHHGAARGAGAAGHLDRALVDDTAAVIDRQRPRRVGREQRAGRHRDGYVLAAGRRLDRLVDHGAVALHALPAGWRQRGRTGRGRGRRAQGLQQAGGGQHGRQRGKSCWGTAAGATHRGSSSQHLA